MNTDTIIAEYRKACSGTQKMADRLLGYLAQKDSPMVAKIGKEATARFNAMLYKKIRATKNSFDALEDLYTQFRSQFSELVSGWNQKIVGIDDENCPIAVCVGGSVSRLEFHEHADLDFLVIADISKLRVKVTYTQPGGCPSVDNSESENIPEILAEFLDETVRLLHALEKEPDMEESHFDRTKGIRGQDRAFHCWTTVQNLKDSFPGLGTADQGIPRVDHPRWSSILFGSVRLWDPADIIFELRKYAAEEIALGKQEDEKVSSAVLGTFRRDIETIFMRNKASLEKHVNPYRRSLKALAIRPVNNVASLVAIILHTLNEKAPDRLSWQEACTLYLAFPPPSKICFALDMLSQGGYYRSVEEHKEQLATDLHLLALAYLYSTDWYVNVCEEHKKSYELLLDKTSRNGIVAIEMILYECDRVFRSLSSFLPARFEGSQAYLPKVQDSFLFARIFPSLAG